LTNKAKVLSSSEKRGEMVCKSMNERGFENFGGWTNDFGRVGRRKALKKTKAFSGMREMREKKPNIYVLWKSDLWGVCQKREGWKSVGVFSVGKTQKGRIESSQD